MSKKQKLIIRLLKVPSDLNWDELHAALLTLGFKEISNTKTGGSRRKFYHYKLELIINLHKPHPSNIVKVYAIKQVIQKLKDARLL
jgi:hypothetical protein